MPTCPVRCSKSENTTQNFIHHHNNYFGSYFSNEIVKKPQTNKTKATRAKQNENQEIVNTEMTILYYSPLPISQTKYNNLQCLKRFLISTEAKYFYKNIYI